MIRNLLILGLAAIFLLGCNYKALVKENEELKLEVATLQDENQRLVDQIALLEQTESQLQANVENLKTARNELDGELNNLQDVVEAAFSENSDLSAKLELLEEQKAALEQTVAELDSIYSEAVSNLSEIRVQHTRIREALDIADARTSDLTTNLDQLQETNQLLVARIQSYETDRIELLRQVAGLTMDRDEQTGSLVALRNELSRLSQELESTLTDREGMEIRLRNVSMENDNLVDDIYSLNSNISDLLSQFRQLRVAYARYIRLLHFERYDAQQGQQE